MELNGTFVLLRVCECFYSTRKKIFKKEGCLAKCYEKKIVHDPYVSDGPLPPALPGATQQHATGHGASQRTGRRPLGHLGHLGHGFELQAGAGGRWPLGHLGHLFFMTQMTQKLAPTRAAGLGLWVIWVIWSSI